jgi:hypothetical protein
MDLMNNLWTGVVEDRDDPEKLGRCKVRIFGYHTEDVNSLSTSDLPWAIPIQSITSAATSGMGNSPVGLVPGSWVVGFFLDGKDAQQPAILGSIAGKPELTREVEEKIEQVNNEKFYLKDTRGNLVYDDSGKPIKKEDTVIDVKDTFGPLVKDNIDALLNLISTEASGNDLRKIGKNNELGKYQIDIGSLVNLGYVSRPYGGIVDYTIVDDNTFWSGRNNISSKEDFLNNESIQETVMIENLKRNYNTLVSLGKITEDMERPVVGALLGTAHFAGAINSDKLDKKTATGKKVRTYYAKFSTGLGGEDLTYYKDINEENNYLSEIDSEVSDNLNNEELSRVIGFRDPNRKYPKYEYAGLSDVNKLATGDTSHISFKVKNNNRLTNIDLARTDQKWSEPESAYAAAYPFNQVIETEAGHLVEFDSTPNAERIHVYHKKGTYIEIDVNGSMVRKVVGDNYEVIDRNNFVFVKGANNLTVEGKTNILVKNDAAIQVDGDLSVTSHGDTLVQSAKNVAVVSKSAVISAKDSLDIVTDGTFKVKAKDIILHASGGGVGIKADQDLSLQSGRANAVNIKGGLSVNTDAAVLRNKMGAATVGGLGTSTLPVPEEKTPDKSAINVLQRTVAREDFFLYDSGEPGSDLYKANLLSEGAISDSVTVGNNRIQSKSYYRSQKPVVQSNATEINNFNYFPRSFRLSRYFTLGHVLVGNRGSSLVAQGGLSEKQIVTNLKNLAINCLDPIKDKYKDMIITSGFRSPFVGSDHNIGAAVDLMFTRTNFRQYKDIAEWIAQNIPYRQLLLEYRFNSTDNDPVATWIHISLLIIDEKIVPSSKFPIGTFKNHSPYSKDRFVNLA